MFLINIPVMSGILSKVLKQWKWNGFCSHWGVARRRLSDQFVGWSFWTIVLNGFAESISPILVQIKRHQCLRYINPLMLFMKCWRWQDKYSYRNGLMDSWRNNVLLERSEVKHQPARWNLGLRENYCAIVKVVLDTITGQSLIQTLPGFNNWLKVYNTW